HDRGVLRPQPRGQGGAPRSHRGPAGGGLMAIVRQTLRMRIVALRENSILAVQTLWDRKFRSFLTMFGVFIGVVIIVLVASVLNGFRKSVVDQVQEFGTSNIYIYRFPFVQTGDLSPEQRQRKKLTLEDAWAIRDLCPAVERVSPGVEHTEIL